MMVFALVVPVIEMPVAFDVPAEGQVDVTDFYVQVPFKQDMYVKALEVRPGVPALVHHAGLYVVDRLPASAKLIDGRVIGPDGKQMSRRDIARANGASGACVLGGRRRAPVPDGSGARSPSDRQPALIAGTSS